MKYSKVLIIFCLFCLTISVGAQNVKKGDKMIYGNVINSLTKERLTNVFVELMDKDSAIIDTVRTNDWVNIFKMTNCWITGVSGDGPVIIRFSLSGYETKCVNVNIKFHSRETFYSLGTFTLDRVRKERKLGEAVVSATRVKFYHKGDTIVYNADAFETSEGSMLDVIIKQFPGAVLKDNGEITLNGRKVESLLLNGEDFFKGDNRMMLDNLPAYTVNNVQVYDRQSEIARRSKTSAGEKSLVMDVHLKRQYSVGITANAELARGTSNRYQGKVFALRFTPQSRIIVFGNANNVSDRSQPGEEDGDVKAPTVDMGLFSTKLAGLNYMVNDKEGAYRINGSASYTYSSSDNQTRSNSVNFLSGGDSYGKNYSMSKSWSKSFDTNHEFEFNLGESSNISFTPSFRFSDNKGLSNSLFGTFNAEVQENILDSLSLWNQNSETMHKLVLNRYINESKNDSRSYSGQMSADYIYKIPHTSDFLTLRASSDYSNSKSNSFSKSLIDFPVSGENSDYRNAYTRNRPNETITNTAAISYNYTNREFALNLGYNYSQRFSRQNQDYFRLEKLGEQWANAPLGILPSEQELIMSIDSSNSSTSAQWEAKHCIQFGGGNTFKLNNKSKIFCNFNGVLEYDRNKLNYDRGSNDINRVRREDLFFQPNLNLFYNSESDKATLGAFFTYSLNTSIPTLIYLADYTDNSNPLNEFHGNPNLKNSRSHNLSLYVSRNTMPTDSTGGTNLGLSMNYVLTQHAVSIGYTFDKTTGKRTTQPTNVEGNYGINLGINYSCPLFGCKDLTLSSQTNPSFNHNVDYVNSGETGTSVRSSVRNTLLEENISIAFKMKKWNVGLNVVGNYTNVASAREDFNSIDAFNFSYGIYGKVKLPLDITFGTSMKMFSRRGYDDAQMNTDDFVWNVSLSRQFLKKRLSLRLEGFDILHQLNNISHTINAQGRTETWTNSVPRYFMLHLSYRLSVLPKK